LRALKNWIGNIPKDIEESSIGQKRVKEKRIDEIERVCDDFNGEQRIEKGVKRVYYRRVVHLEPTTGNIVYDNLIDNLYLLYDNG